MRISDWSSDVCSSDLVLDIGVRYLCDHPLEGTTAIITQLLFPALVFLSLAHVAERDGHVRVELIWTKLKGSFGDVVVIVFSLAIAAFWGIIAYKAGLRAYDAYVLNQRPIGAVGIPLAVSYGVVCLGSAVGAVASLGPILRLRRPADPASTTGQQVSLRWAPKWISSFRSPLFSSSSFSGCRSRSPWASAAYSVSSLRWPRWRRWGCSTSSRYAPRRATHPPPSRCSCCWRSSPPKAASRSARSRQTTQWSAP